MTKKFAGLAVAAALTLTALAGCSADKGSDAPITLPSDVVSGFTVPAAGDKGGQDNPVTIGVVGASNPQFAVLQKAAEAEGIHIKFQDFTDYAQPNPAVSSGELDLNQFQHIIYLASYNQANKDTLAPIGSTAIYPMGVYSRNYTSLDDIPDGATIAIPDDQTNGARALQILQSAGLIKLKDDGTPSFFVDASDVDQAASRVKIDAIAADETARAIDDPNIAAAAINNDYINDTGLSPKDALVQDDPTSDLDAPYINIWVSRAEDKTLPVYLEIVRLAHSDAWNQALQENSGNTAVLINKDAAYLQSVLDDAVAQIDAA